MDLLTNIIANDYNNNPKDFSFEHVTTVRKSCLEVHGARIKLRRLTIDCVSIINGFVVRRLARMDDGKCYGIGEFRFTFDAALDIIEGRAQLPPPKKKYTQLELPLGIDNAA